MIAAPTSLEWMVIYAPLALVSIIAMIVELRTTRIPNLLSLVTMLYLFGARVTVGPAPIQQYLTSTVMIAFIFIGVFYSQRFLAAGAAKFAVAISLALLPWMAHVLIVASFAVLAIGLLIHKLRGAAEGVSLPGSVIVSALTAGIILMTVVMKADLTFI